MARLEGLILPDRGVLAVSGPDARSFLQGLITNDIDKVTPHQAIYAALLTPQGKFLFDFFIAEQDGALLLDAERDRADALLKRLSMYRLRLKVELDNRSDSYAVAACWGDDAAGHFHLDSARGAAGAIVGGVAFVDPRHSAMGVRLMAPASALEETLRAGSFEPAAWVDYERRRLTLGLADGSRDMPPEQTFLLENNIEALGGVDFKKGCYVGQELTARTKYRGTLKKLLVPVRIEGPLPAPGTPVRAGHQEVGVVRTGLEDRALALLRLDRVMAAEKAAAPLVAGEARLILLHDHLAATAS